MVAFIIFAAAFAGSSDDFDIRAVPAADRIAYANAIADWSDEPNAREDFDWACTVRVDPYRLSDWRKPERVRAARWLNTNDSALPYRPDWPTDRRGIICEYLEANTEALDALRRAATRRYLYRPFAPDQSLFPPDPNEPPSPPRLSEATINGITDTRVSAKLLCLSARDLANGGQWDAAFEENARVFRVASFARSGMGPLSGLIGKSIEILALRQLAGFIEEHGTQGMRERLDAIVAQRAFEPPAETVETLEQLTTWDFIEQYYDWARDEALQPRLRETLTTVIEPSEPGIKLGDFRSVDDFREALRASSADDAWHVFLDTEALARRVDDLPLHIALRDATRYESEYQAILHKNALFSLYSLYGPTRSLDVSHRAETLTDGLRVVVAILDFRERHGQLPASLDDVASDATDALPRDPYTDAPFVYRIDSDGTRFSLYSVGPNQVDDGGVNDVDVNFVARFTGEAQDESRTRDDFPIWPPERPKLEEP